MKMCKCCGAAIPDICNFCIYCGAPSDHMQGSDVETVSLKVADLDEQQIQKLERTAPFRHGSFAALISLSGGAAYFREWINDPAEVIGVVRPRSVNEVEHRPDGKLTGCKLRFSFSSVTPDSLTFRASIIPESGMRVTDGIVTVPIDTSVRFAHSMWEDAGVDLQLGYFSSLDALKRCLEQIDQKRMH